MTREYSRDEIGEIGETGKTNVRGFPEVPVIEGLKGRLFAKDGNGVIWTFSPIGGGRYRRFRTTNFKYDFDTEFGERKVRAPVEFSDNWRDWHRGDSNEMDRVRLKEAGMPARHEVKYALAISRRKFALIYHGLMNELNVRKYIDSRAQPFDSRLQETRRYQARLMRLTGLPLADIHIMKNFPEDVEKKISKRFRNQSQVGMTNDAGACIHLNRNGRKLTLMISSRVPEWGKTEVMKEIGFVDILLGNLLKQEGIKFTRSEQNLER
jgi:hypothetical protein